MEKKVYIISVLIQDRIGIIRDVTGCVTELGGNLTDLNQIVMGGVFYCCKFKGSFFCSQA